jgi:hypothetical protein
MNAQMAKMGRLVGRRQCIDFLDRMEMPIVATRLNVTLSVGMYGQCPCHKTYLAGLVAWSTWWVMECVVCWVDPKNPVFCLLSRETGPGARLPCRGRNQSRDRKQPMRAAVLWGQEKAGAC